VISITSLETDKKYVVTLEELIDVDFPLDEPFFLLVNHEGVKYEFIIRFASDNQELIAFGSGAYNPRKYNPPVFNRHSWINDFKQSVLYYNDPTLYNNNIITLGWGVGRHDEWYLEVIARIIGSLTHLQGIKNQDILFFGSSGGGYTSIILSTILKGSAALVNNPQIYLKKYRAGHWKNMVNACFPGLEDEIIMEKYGYRFDVTEIFGRENYIPKITYLVNINSENDFQNQLQPFLEYLNSTELFQDQIKVLLYPSSEGHSGVLDKSETISLIKNHFQDEEDFKDEIKELNQELLNKDKIIHQLQTCPSVLKSRDEFEKILEEKKQRIIELQTLTGYTRYKTRNITIRLKKRFKKVSKMITSPYYLLHQYLPGVDLEKLTVIIPYRKTSDRTREKNLDITLRYLNTLKIPNVIISEHSDDSQRQTLLDKYRKLFPSFQVIHTDADGEVFNRSLARNRGVMHSTTPYIATSDLDCITRKRNIKIALGLLERGYDVVHPFNHRVTDIIDKEAFIRNYNLKKVNSPEQYRNRADGGIIFWNKKSFIRIGMENEYFLGWGGEDNEIMLRARLCGLKHYRIDDTLYHLHHHRPQKRTTKNEDLEEKTRKLKSKDECQEMVKNWPWVKEAWKTITE
jgi:hypothetical protein